LCTGALSCWNRKVPSPNCCHKVWSTESSRMSFYCVDLRFPFTGTNGPNLNHEKQSKTIIPPPLNFTIDTMHWGSYRSPGIRQTQIHPSDCQMVKRDSSLQRTCLQSPMAASFTPFQPPIGIAHCDLWLVCGCTEIHLMKLPEKQVLC
jgi:hypothetical protein